MGICERFLPREGLLEEVDVPPGLARASGEANVVSQRTGAADADGAGAVALDHLRVDKGLDVGLAGEHLDAGRGRVDLLGRAGTGDEQENLEHIAAVGHRQDLRHPRADPLKMLGRLDHPDESDAADGGSALVIGFDEVAHMRDLVSNADTGSEEHDGAVRGQILEAIRPLDQGRGGDLSRGALLDLLVESVGETSATADKKAHGSLAETRQVETVEGHALFLTPRLLLLAPGEGKRVRSPPADRRDVQVDVLAGLELPGTSNLEVDAEAVAGERLDFGLGATVADVPEDDPEEAHEALDNPDAQDGLDDVKLVKLTRLTMDPDTSNTESSEQNVEVEEDLVESMADRASGLDEDEQESGGALLWVSHWGTRPVESSQLTIVPQRMNWLWTRPWPKAAQPPLAILGTR